MFKCNNNGWCIDKKFTCLNLNPCGDDSDCSAKLKTPVKTILDTIIESAQDLLWIVAVAAVCYFIIKFWRARRGRHGNFEDIPILGWFHRKLCGSSSRDQVRSFSVLMPHNFQTNSEGVLLSAYNQRAMLGGCHLCGRNRFDSK